MYTQDKFINKRALHFTIKAVVVTAVVMLIVTALMAEASPLVAMGLMLVPSIVLTTMLLVEVNRHIDRKLGRYSALTESGAKGEDVENI